ncbi:hypothetical protein Tco_1169208, partial [Tanacetum coccineum]
ADVELKDTIMMAMPKHVGEGSMHVLFVLSMNGKPPRCTSYKVFGHVLDECPKNIGLDVAKNLNNPIHVLRGVSKDAKPKKEVSNPNLFDALNSVENDVDLGKPLEKIDYSGDHDSEDEVEPLDN